MSIIKKILTDNNSNTLVNDDCLNYLSFMKNGETDIIVTSPPYNLGIEYNTYKDNLSRADYLEWTGKWLKEIRRIMNEEGSLFLNIGSKPTDPMVPFEVLNVASRFFKLQNTFHWIKSIHIPYESSGKYGVLNDDLTVGHYKPINSKRFVNDCHEYVFHLTINGNVKLERLEIGVPYQDKSNIKRWKSKVHCRGNTWFIPYRTIKSSSLQRPHPASFPSELAEMCMKLHGGDKVKALDPFLGIGNSGLAAARLGIDFTGIEMDKEYFKEAELRIENYREYSSARNLAL